MCGIIPYILDYWANPAVHLFLLKSSTNKHTPMLLLLLLLCVASQSQSIPSSFGNCVYPSFSLFRSFKGNSCDRSLFWFERKKNRFMWITSLLLLVCTHCCAQLCTREWVGGWDGMEAEDASQVSHKQASIKNNLADMLIHLRIELAPPSISGSNL